MSVDCIIRAHAFAMAAHHGQYDRDGRPHMDHVNRVVKTIRGLCTEPEASEGHGYYTLPGAVSTPVAIAVAYLHDVLEDTNITAEYLVEAGFTPAVIGGVRLLTRDPEAPYTYMEYVANLIESDGECTAVGAAARLVKYADLADNLRRSEAEGSGAANRYRRALRLIAPACQQDGTI